MFIQKPVMNVQNIFIYKRQKMDTIQYVNQEANCDVSGPWNTTQQ